MLAGLLALQLAEPELDSIVACKAARAARRWRFPLEIVRERYDLAIGAVIAGVVRLLRRRRLGTRIGPALRVEEGILGQGIAAYGDGARPIARAEGLPTPACCWSPSRSRRPCSNHSQRD